MNRRGIFTSVAVAVAICAVPVVGTIAPAGAAATLTVALYEMNEPAGSTVLVDSSGNGLNGASGPNNTKGVVFNGATAHRYLNRSPNLPPTEPQRLDTVPDNIRLDAETQDYAVTVRYRTSKPFGNLIQKGQNGTTGGYFKIELPVGRPTCLFKGVQNGRTVQRAIEAPLNMGYELDDNQWHTVRCERLATRIALYIDGVEVKRLVGSTGSISNNQNLSIAGKSNCDQVETTCDYFVGDIDWVRIEKGAGTTNAPPTASFTNTCTYLVCSVNGSASSDPNGPIASYAWNWGDNATATGATPPAHTYANEGMYTIRLTVTDSGGLTNVLTRVVNVAPNTPPTAAFTYECVDFTCTFNGSTSTDPNGPIASYAWLFAPDNSTATGATPAAHVFPGAGDYDVALTVTDSAGAPNTVTHTVTLAPNTPPTAAFDWTCANYSCTFDGSDSTDPGGSIASYAWDFGAGSATGPVNPTIDFGAPGDHPVTLIVTDNLGAPSDAVMHTVTVAPNTPPTAAFDWTCADYSCTFDGSDSTDPGGSIASYAWDFGAGSATGPVNPTIDFGAPGDHPVTLVVTDSLGAPSDLVMHTVTVAPNVAPVAEFTFACDELACTFTSTSTDESGPIESYAWDFGDGDTGTGPIASHTYLAPGDYEVELIASDFLTTSDPVTHTASPTETVEPISFVGQTTASNQATTHQVNVPAGVAAGDGLLMFFSTGTNATIAAPQGVPGWVQLDTISGTSGSTRVWRKVAGATDAGAQVRITVSALSKANITIVAYRGTSATDPVATWARQLQTNSTASRTTPQAAVNTPSWAVSYWMHRDSATTALTPPGDVTVRTSASQSGGGRVTVLLADSDGSVPGPTYGGKTATAGGGSSTFGTTWTIVLAPA